MKRQQLVLFGATFILVLFAIVGTWYFILRQPTKEHDALNKMVSSAKEKQKLVSDSVSSTKVAFFIDDSFLSTYTQRISDLSAAVDAIYKSPVLTQNSQLQSTYATYKGTLQSYVTSNSQLASSIKLYLDVASSCKNMGYALDSIREKNSSMTPAIFDSNAKNCKAAVEAGKTAPDAQFNDQFLARYLSNMNTLLESYRQEFSADGNASALKVAQSAVDKAWNEILSMNNTRLDLTRSPDLSDTFSKLEQSTANQG